MDLKFTFEGDDAVQKAVAFKSFLEDQRLHGIDTVQVDQTTGQPGDQGIGKFLGSIITSLTGNSETVKSLIGAMGKFLELFDGRVIMEDGKGGKLTIPGGKKLTPEQIENIAVQFSQRK